MRNHKPMYAQTPLPSLETPALIADRPVPVTIPDLAILNLSPISTLPLLHRDMVHCRRHWLNKFNRRLLAMDMAMVKGMEGEAPVRAVAYYMDWSECNPSRLNAQHQSSPCLHPIRPVTCSQCRHSLQQSASMRVVHAHQAVLGH